MSHTYELPWIGPRCTPKGTCLVMANPGLGDAASCWLIPVRPSRAHAAAPEWELVPGSVAVHVAYTMSCSSWTEIHPRDQAFPVETAHVLVVLYYPSVVEHQDSPSFQPGAVLSSLRRRYAGSDLTLACIELAPRQSQTGTLCFAFGSCQYPAGMLDRPVAEASYARLAQRLKAPGLPKPEFLLLLGDQIYADASAGLLDPKRADDRYELPHRSLFRMKPVREVLRHIPAYMMLDDHEITDNWEPYDPVQGGWQYEQGRLAYWRYQRAKTKFLPAPGAAPVKHCVPHNMYFRFKHGEVSFFVADTRTRRAHRSAGTLRQDDTLILDRPSEPYSQPGAKPRSRQSCLLEMWLLMQPAGSPKIITSASAFLPRDVADSSDLLYLDGWDGYPQSMERLLGFIAVNNIQKVVFLSGDMHLTCVSTATVQAAGNAVKFVSIHCSGLYAPFPFANANEADLRDRDQFDFSYQGNACTCSVETRFAGPGDGYGLVHLSRSNEGDWTLDFTFDGCREDGTPNCFMAGPIQL